MDDLRRRLHARLDGAEVAHPAPLFVDLLEHLPLRLLNFLLASDEGRDVAQVQPRGHL